MKKTTFYKIIKYTHPIYLITKLVELVVLVLWAMYVFLEIDEKKKK